MSAYIEILDGEMIYLSGADLCFIGEFTRENISAWLDRGPLSGYEDFHAVCGDVDIPWAKEDSTFPTTRPWERIRRLHDPK
jgi:hypothetical protein